MNKEHKTQPSTDDELTSKIRSKILEGDIDAQRVVSSKESKPKPKKKNFFSSSENIRVTGKTKKQRFPLLRVIVTNLITLLAILFIVLLLVVEEVDTDEIGLEYNFVTKTYKQILPAGIHLTSPFTDVRKYPSTTIFPERFEVLTNTSDGDLISFQVRYAYSLSEEDISNKQLHRIYKDTESFEKLMIEPQIEKILSRKAGETASSANFSMNRNLISKEIEEELAEILNNRGVYIEGITIFTKS